MDKKDNLLEFRRNFFSQNGEDGIIEEILKKLNLKNVELCEFGAWDGVHLSNTFNLVKNHNAKAIFIEGDDEKYKDLIKTANLFKNITPIKKFVDIGENTLDNILSKTYLKNNFDILSIDIDSNDLEVWESLKHYQPKIVIIEIGSSILPGILQRYNRENETQNSFTSTIIVGKNKGYTPIAHTGNLIFIKNEYLSKINLSKYLIDNPEKLFINDWVEKNVIVRLLKRILPLYIVKLIRKIKKNFIKIY